MDNALEIKKKVFVDLKEYLSTNKELFQDDISMLEIYLTTELSAEKKFNPFPELHKKTLASVHYRALSSALTTLKISKNAEDFFEKLENSLFPHQLNWNMLITEFSLEKMDQIAIKYMNTLREFQDITKEPIIPFGRANQDWLRCRGLHREGDSFYYWDGSADEWVETYRTSGYCLVRRNKILDYFEIGETILS